MLFRMAARRLSGLRGRLWPPLWLVEQRQRELKQTLEVLHSAVGDVREAQSDLRRAQDELRGFVELMANDIANREHELVSRLRRTQALAARAYEAAQGWPEKLAAARASDEYELPYMDSDPLISIPIPTYHSPDSLVDVALASVLTQTHENWEAIVVGDHCVDDTAERVQAIGDPRVRWHNLPVREPDPEDPFERWAVKGTIPRATGMDLADGLWIAPLGHDDAWDPDHLETLLAAARESRAEIVYSRMRAVEVSGGDAASEWSVGAWPPRLAQWNCQAAMFHGALRFVRPDRACALASEPNDWNLARRAWEAGVRFHFVDRETATLYVYPRWERVDAEYAAQGRPPAARAHP